MSIKTKQKMLFHS